MCRMSRSLIRLVKLIAMLAAALGADRMHQAKAGDSQTTALPTYVRWVGDFDEMERRHLIRFIVPYSKTIFFIDKGEQFGTAAEWGDEFEKWINKGKKSQLDRIRIVFVPTPRDQLFAALNEGRGDIVAANLTITEDRLEKVDFTDPVLKNVHEILVTGPSAPAIEKPEDLSGKELYVRKSSSYYEHLVALNANFDAQNIEPIKLTAADENLEDEDLLEMVDAGLLPFVVVDDHVARIWAKMFKSITVRPDIVIHDKGTIAAALRKNSPLFKAVLNRFLKEGTVTDGFATWLRQSILHQGENGPAGLRARGYGAVQRACWLL